MQGSSHLVEALHIPHGVVCNRTQTQRTAGLVLRRADEGQQASEPARRNPLSPGWLRHLPRLEGGRTFIAEVPHYKQQEAFAHLAPRHSTRSACRRPLPPGVAPAAAAARPRPQAWPVPARHRAWAYREAGRASRAARDRKEGLGRRAGTRLAHACPSLAWCLIVREDACMTARKVSVLRAVSLRIRCRWWSCSGVASC